MAKAETSVSISQPEERDPENTRNPLLPEEHRKNFYDVIQPRKKEAELLGRAESEELSEIDFQNTMSYKELTEMTADFSTSISPVLSLEDSDLEPPEAMELLMCVEEPEVEEIMDNIPETTLTPATPPPESPVFISLPELTSEALHYLPCPQELPLPSRQGPVSEPAEDITSFVSESIDKPNESLVSSVSPAEEAPLATQPQPAAPAACSFNLPVLLTGGIALAAVVGVMTYVLTRK